jgi:hypothetical protein
MNTIPATRMSGDVHLVGSMPFDSAEDVFRASAATIGNLVTALPDGEVGDRRNWVRYLPLRVYSEHPQLEETARLDIQSVMKPGDEKQTATKRPAPWTFRIRPGESLRFEDLHYGRYAIESYEVFKRLRDAGVIPSGVRFQVAFPASGSGINPFFEDVSQWDEAHRAYEAGIRGEIAKMLAVIPAEDLLIQWDLAWEVVDIASGDDAFYDFWPDETPEQKLQRHSRQLDELWKGIPDEVLYGYHWCYGTRGGWPMTAMEDLSLCVSLSNEAVKRAGRRVDYVHMPVSREPDEAFFAPLADLDIGEARLYLGMIHHGDGSDAFRRRLELARVHADGFGIASVCGYGRVSPAELDEALKAHRACAEMMREAD